jgi:hypothetical protein
MPNTRTANAVRLEFEPGALVHDNLSGAAFTGKDWLWVAGDEACAVDRLQRLSPVGDERLRFGKSVDFQLPDLLDLPGGVDDEADLEGLDVVGDWLWLVGSHGLKRKNAKPGLSHADNAKRLSKLSLDANRRLIACVPIETNAKGVPRLVRETRDGRRAMCLKGDAKDNELTRLLASDRHVGPYMAIPGKDNGFDIEGLAVDGERMLLGLRGPVLRGWSAIVEIAIETRGGQLRLKALDKQGTLLRKHFLQLEGLGIRDLHFSGEDLYVLAGPTMVLNGDIRVFRWPQARSILAANSELVRFETEAITESVALPHGRGTDRAEAFCDVPMEITGGKKNWLVLYDAPGPQRRGGEYTVFGDLLRHD